MEVKDSELELENPLENYIPLNELYTLTYEYVEGQKAGILKFKRKKFDTLEEVIEVIKKRDNLLREKSYFNIEKNNNLVLKEEYAKKLDLEQLVKEIENRKEIIKGGFALYECAMGLTNVLKLFYGRENFMIVKLGIDPTKDLHLGHLSVLLKAKVLQELGAPVVIVLGDYTATVGDPSGGLRSEKPALERAREISKDYIKKILKILDDKKTFFVYNSDFHLPDNRVYDLVKVVDNLKTSEVIKKPIFLGDLEIEENKINEIYGKLKRGEIDFEEFKKEINLSSNQQVSKKLNFPLSRLLYPFLQGLDSILLGAMIELGGTDQRENLLLTRELQRKYDVEEQALIYEPLIIGKDGKKMSKSLNNYISINTPEDIFEGIYRFPDFVKTEILKTRIEELRGEKKTVEKLIFFPAYIDSCVRKKKCYKDNIPFLEKITEESIKEFEEKMREQYNPAELKIEISKYLCELFFGKQGAERGYNFYLENIKKQELPQEIPYAKIGDYGGLKLLDVLNRYTNLSKSELRRFGEQQGLKIITSAENIRNTKPIKIEDLFKNTKEFLEKYKDFTLEYNNQKFLLLSIGKQRYLKIGE